MGERARVVAGERTMPTILERVRSAAAAFRTPGISVAPGVPVPVSQPYTPGSETAPTTQTTFGPLAAGDPPIVDKYPIVLGPYLNPAAVSSALRLAERGYMRRQSDILTELRETVTHLQSELSKREKAIAGVGYTITPANTPGMGKRAARDAAKISDYVQRRFDEVADLDDDIEHLAGAIYYGRSASEIAWGRDNRGVCIDTIHDVQPKRLSYAADWRIHLYDEAGNDRDPKLGMYPGVDIRATWPDRFIIHEPRTMGAEVPTRQGLGRVLIWAGMFWKWSTRDWMQFAELYAKPWRIGTYPKGADERDIAILKAGLLSLSGLTTAVFPEGCKPEFIEPVRSGSIHTDLVSMWNAEMSKVIAGGTLQSETKGDGGNRALGEVHERNGQRIVMADGRSMNATVRRDLVRPLVRMQFGHEAAQTLCPIFALKTDPPVDKDKAASRVLAAVDRGVAIDSDQYRETYLDGMRKPDPGAPIMQPFGKVTSTVAGDNTDDNPGGGAPTEDPKGDAKDPKKDPKQPKPDDEDDGNDSADEGDGGEPADDGGDAGGEGD